MTDPIIAAIDPGRDDASPATLGALFARLTGAPLLLTATYPGDASVDRLYPEYARALRLEAERALRRAAAALTGAGDVTARVAIRAVPAAGSPAGALHELADRERAGTIVIGSSQRGTAARALPAAVTDRLLHGAPCGVAVAPFGFSLEQAIEGPRLIGVAFTDTPEGHAALSAGRRLAQQADALVRVLVVAEPLDVLFAATLDGLALADAERANDERARHALRTGIDAIPAERSGGGEILAGRPADALAAATADLDLMVCGSRGYGPLRTLLAGSTSHALVRTAACPVLVVPRRQAAADRAVSDALTTPVG